MKQEQMHMRGNQSENLEIKIIVIKNFTLLSGMKCRLQLKESENLPTTHFFADKYIQNTIKKYKYQLERL